MASQLNPSSSAINHLLLGQKPRGAGGSRLASALPGSRPTPLSQSQGSLARQHCGSLPSTSSGSPGRSGGGGVGSPWRAHVRVHRRNIARARAQLGFGDSEEREEEEEEKETGLEGGERREVGENDEDGQKETPDPSGSGSVCEENPLVVDERKEAEVSEVVVRLDSLDLEENPNPPASKPEPHVPLLPPPPSSKRHRESDSSGSERNTDSDSGFPNNSLPPPHHSTNTPSSSPTSPSPSPAPVPTSAFVDPSCSTSTRTPTSSSGLQSSPSANSLSSVPLPASSTFYKTPSPSTPSLSSISSSSGSRMSSSPSTPTLPSPGAIAPQQQIFSPFPSVKQPRKSAAARNLGLYGPTSRTPTVHFPQLSRGLNRSSGAGTTGRR